ncbi:MAG TPA: hypothetical protein VM914_02610 [Pyrinomonadaceae bacterium]|jgi:hypothetical protein|nr:hypothetical protein [Pyrinomonadaceae bacterium]
MEITFTKTGARTYEVVVRRDDGVTLRVRTPDKPLAIPHDMAHYVVERELNMERGFWGSIAAGVIFGTVRVVSGRQPPHAAERSEALIKASYREQAAAELYVAVLQRVAAEGKEQDLSYVNSCLDEVWRPFRWPRPHVNAEGAMRVCRALREAESIWAALPVGESVKVTWASAQKKGAGRRKRA